ncbi:MAG: ABC transporter substrate-binding protein [Geminicoccaceae bacterium]
MLTRRILLASAAIAGLAFGAAQVRAAEEVEVIHWWTSGGEAAALQVLRSNLEKEGVTWKDAAISGGGGDQARTVLQARMAAGNPPTAMQMLGLVVQDWAGQGVLGDLTPLAEKDGWDNVIPPALQNIVKYDGHYVAAPFNMHSTNWVWVNKALFDKVGGTEPKTFEDFQALAQKFKDAGVIPVAHGGQAWQEATIFDGAVISAGGPEFYKKAFIELDEEALGSDTMAKAFDQLRAIRGMVDPNFPGRDWNLATAMVINGQAGMQIMGDWAKGEWINAGKVPGTDVLCFRYPGTQGSVTFNSDSFGMMKVSEAEEDAQFKLAAAIMDPAFQESFNLKKGSIPARNDVPDTNFDACGKKAIADAKEATAAGSLMGSMAHGHAAPEAVKGAVYDVVTEFFNSDMSSADASKKLAEAVANAK